MSTWDTSGFLGATARARAAVVPAAELHLRDAAQSLLAAVQGAAGFPYDTGSLQESGAVSDPLTLGTETSIDITFGGPSSGVNDPVTYAEIVHFGPNGPRFPAGRPYLADPLTSDGPQHVEEAAAAVFADVAAAWRG